jgi:hypothetical protein
MKRISTLTLITSIWALFSCKTKNKEKELVYDSVQDDNHTIVRQKIADEEVVFDFLDFNDLKNNKYYDRFLVGQLNLTTGKVVCTDPMYRALGLPQDWIVPKGKYPVCIYIGLEDDFEGRVAYAELVIKDEIPTFWRLSLINETFLTDTLEKKINGMYPVESGLSCFADYETFQLYDKDVRDYHQNDTSHNYYNDKLEKLFRANKDVPKSSRGEDWLNYKLANSDRNIIMFGSGYGDGLYPRYVGYDDKGNVVKLVTDFVQISSNK